MSQSAHTTESHATAPAAVSTIKSAATEVLCPHCLRTATNGIKCQGICVADSNY